MTAVVVLLFFFFFFFTFSPLRNVSVTTPNATTIGANKVLREIALRNWAEQKKPAKNNINK